jgi:peptidoglycan hydrolase-like protein with peptidoglycan-binding domain
MAALTKTQVQRLQTALNGKGATLITDGKFGPLTLSALQRFQRAQGLIVRYDYTIDDATARALGLDFSNAPVVGTTPTPSGRFAGATVTGEATPAATSAQAEVQQNAAALQRAYGLTLASAVAALAVAPALVPLAPLAAGMVPLSLSTGIFATTAGVVYRQIPSGTGGQVLQKTGQTIFDFAVGAGAGVGLGTVLLVGGGIVALVLAFGGDN